MVLDGTLEKNDHLRYVLVAKASKSESGTIELSSPLSELFFLTFAVVVRRSCHHRPHITIPHNWEEKTEIQLPVELLLLSQ